MLTRGGKAEPVSRETKFSGADGDREKFIFLVLQKTTRRIDWQPYPFDLYYYAICNDPTYTHTHIYIYIYVLITLLSY